MRCIACENRLPINNYALVEGAYFCLTCFLGQCIGLPARQAIRENYERVPRSSNKTAL
jgi:hypothetical protein